MDAPLSGVRVVDFSRVLAGPLATMILADLGADVVKVERPGTGDDTRRWGPPFVGEDAAYFLSLNRNKRSVVLDLSTADGRHAARDLAIRADVVVENFRPGRASAWTTDPSPLSIRASCIARWSRSPMKARELQGPDTTLSFRPSRA